MSRALRLVAAATVLLLTALATTPAPAAAGPVAPAANTAKNAELKVWADPTEHAYVSSTQEFALITHRQDLGPDNTYSGDVTWEYTAPGGTHFAFTPKPTDPACHTFVAYRHFSCVQTTEQMVISGAEQIALPFYVDSIHTTPGRISETCACDKNTSDNSAALIVHIDGATSSPTHTAKPKPTATHTKPAATPSATPSTVAPSPSPALAPSPSVPASSAPVFSEPGSPSVTDAALGTPSHRSPGPLVLMLAMVAAGIVALGFGGWQLRRRRGQT